MKTIFEQLQKQTRHTRLIHCTDATIEISSSQKKLVDFLCEPLQYLFPDTHGESRQSVSCVIERTTVMEDWPNSIETNGPPVKLDHEELGPSTVIPTPPGATVLIDNIGSIYHSGEGQFLCLIKPPNKKLQENELQDVPAFLTVLVSETLLLVNKLLVHAGCVGRNGVCQIWTGDGGSGKTTRIVSLVAKGWDFYGEDQLIVGKDKNDNWIVWPYWRHINASPETMKLFPVQPDISNQSPSKKNKYTFGDIEKTLNCQRPAPCKLTNINLLVPGNKKIFADLDFRESFPLVAPGFLHSLLPGSITHAMDMVLDLLSSVPVQKISWDMLDQLDASQEAVRK